jgi:hypothetical protein
MKRATVLGALLVAGGLSAAGKSVGDAAASIDLTRKYPKYKNERYKAAITAVYAELKK